MGKATAPLQTHEVAARIAKRHDTYEWLFLEEMRNSTGFGATRSADAIAFKMYGDLSIHGYEYKVTRSDWLKELQDPDKADTFKVYCDRWWLAVGDKDIVRPGELPPDWGLLVPYGKTMRVSRGAPELKPRPISRGMQASFMQRMYREAHSDETHQKEMEEARVKAKEHAECTAKSHVDMAMQERDSALAGIVAFEKASGIKISEYRGSNQGAMFKLFMQIQQDQAYLRRLAITAKELQSLSEAMTTFIGGITQKGAE